MPFHVYSTSNIFFFWKLYSKYSNPHRHQAYHGQISAMDVCGLINPSFLYQDTTSGWSCKEAASSQQQGKQLAVGFYVYVTL